VIVLPRLYAILDTALARQHGWTPADLGRAYLDGGARLIQVRAKDEPSGAFLELCDALVAAGERYGASIIVNDRADLARLSGAAGVHVGQEDLPPADARAIVGPEAIVGVSTHSADQIEAALIEPVSYVAVGPVFGSATKDTGYSAVGLDLVARARARARDLPVVAVGGITLERAADVLAAGASAVAVISDLLTGGEPVRRARDFLRRLEA
jgi:thiamine-phosphate pyrophosphorylase